MSDPPILRVDGVTYRIGKRAYLSSVSFELRAQEIFCLLGPSGAGKTTLLRIIAGLQRATGGLVLIRGVPQEAVSPHQRDIGFVFQDPDALLPHLTVFENVAFPLKVGRKIPSQFKDIRSAVNNTLAAVHLADKSHRRPSTLSGGERQRVALARAFVYQPSLLLMDEPLNSLDNITKSELFSYIAKLRDAFGTTCLYVTHDEREAQRLADRVGLLFFGQLLQIGPPTDVFENPATPDVARITGEWNLLKWDETLAKLVGPRSATLVDAQPQAIAFPIRKTRLTIGATNEPAALTLSASVVSLYHYHGEQYALLELDHQQLIAPCPFNVSPPLGELMPISIDLAELRPFATAGL